jgi:hypothetical protein
MGLSGQHHAPATVPLVAHQDMKMGGPQSQSGIQLWYFSPVHSVVTKLTELSWLHRVQVYLEICSALCAEFDLTLSLPSWSRALLEKLTVAQLVNKFPVFYRTKSLITKLTTAHHLSLSWTRLIQSTLYHLIKIHFNIILSEPQFFHVVTLLQVPISLLSHTSHMPHPFQHPSFDHPNNIWWGVQTMKLLIMHFCFVSCYFLPQRKYLKQPILKLWSCYYVTFTSCYFRSLGSKYSPEHPIFRQPLVMFFT